MSASIQCVAYCRYYTGQRTKNDQKQKTLIELLDLLNTNVCEARSSFDRILCIVHC